jgi:hypothetical protein
METNVVTNPVDPGEGYRLLQAGEVVQAGDEVESANGWQLVSQTFLSLFSVNDIVSIKIDSDEVGYWRRKLA